MCVRLESGSSGMQPRAAAAGNDDAPSAPHTTHRSEQGCVSEPHERAQKPASAIGTRYVSRGWLPSGPVGVFSSVCSGRASRAVLVAGKAGKAG